MASPHETPPDHDGVEMPQTTVWPMVLALGVALLAMGFATTLVLSVVGAGLFVIGLGGWIAQLLPGRGHVHEPRVEPERRPQPVAGIPGTVEHLLPGMPEYRFQLPVAIHPISAGIKGGIVGGLVMPIPALAYGLLSGHGIWFPINLLAGMVYPSLDDMKVSQLEQFNPEALLMAIFIHAVISVTMGLMYGVLLPTFPTIAGGPMLFGGIIMPLMWTGASYGMMGVINPVLRQYVDWPWFILSQFIFGITAAIMVIRSEKVAIAPVGGKPS